VKFLLVTDLDNTLIGDDRATIALNQNLASLNADIEQENLVLVYATGRSLVSYKDLCYEFLLRTGEALLDPHYLVAGVGSEIYRKNTLDRDWANHISSDWERQAIATLASSIPELLPQAETEQNQWKLSYLVKSKDNFATIQNLKRQLNQAGLKAQIIFSSDRDLDILPRNSGKGKAVTYLRERLGIDMKQTLVCGDSGNDITMFEQKTLGVIVQNSQHELLEWHQLHSYPQHYVSQKGYAWGILEAIAHFQLNGNIKIKPQSNGRG
jgi:sucrose-6-phosphatase